MRKTTLFVAVIAVAVVLLLALQFVSGSFRLTADRDVHAVLGPPDAHAGTVERLDARTGKIDYGLLERRLTAMMDDHSMVGLAVAVIENGEITFARGYGETLKGSGEQVTPDTVFRWASLSKGVAATTLALMAEDGKLRLEAPVSRYSYSLKLPEGGQYRASVYDLLSQSLGLPRNAYDGRLENNESPMLLRLGLSQLSTACEPGQCYSYQNVAFDAASEIVEELSPGKSYEGVVQQRLLRPLGMRTASVSLRGLEESERWARSHDRAGREIEVVPPYYRVPAAGGMNGSILDLAIWMQAQMGEDPEVIPPRIVALLHRPRTRTQLEDRRMRRYLGRLTDSYYGLGWRIYDYVGHRVIGHRGAVRGYRSEIMFDPEFQTGVVLLSNSDSGRPFSIPMDIFDRLYDLPDSDWMSVGAPNAPQSDTSPAPVSPRTTAQASSEGRRRPGELGGRTASP